MDLTAITSILGLTKDAIGAVRDASEIATKSGDAGLRERLSHALVALNQVLAQYGELTIEHVKAKEEIEALRRQLTETKAMQFTFGVYWRAREDGSLDGPFAPEDWDRERKAVRLRFDVLGLEGSFVFSQYQKGSWRIPKAFVEQHRVFTTAELAMMSSNIEEDYSERFSRRSNRDLDGLL